MTFSTIPARATDVTVAVAANFTLTFAKISRLYGSKTGHKVTAIAGSTGRLTAQITQGAPFDLLLAADHERPAFLVETGLADANDRQTYARGSLILWHPQGGDKDVQELLQTGGFTRIALANPRLAPYGLASMAVLQALNLTTIYQNRLVKGDSVGQVFGFIDRGAVEAGFISAAQFNALSAEKRRKSSIWQVPGRLHPPIKQDMVLLKRAAGNAAARGLFRFLKSPKIQALIKQDGYGLP